jgi:hypothetical protein
MIAAVAYWQLDIRRALENLVGYLGVSPGGPASGLIMSVVLPLSVVLVVGVSLWTFRMLVWPLCPFTAYRGGWWIYALGSPWGDRPARSVGYFRLHHDSSNAQVLEAAAYYVPNGKLEPPRPWFSEVGFVGQGTLRLIFSMRAIDPPAKVRPAHYDGYVAVRRVNSSPVIGCESWTGEFQDFGERRHVFGRFYAEWLGRYKRLRIEDMEVLLQARAPELLRRVDVTIERNSEDDDVASRRLGGPPS